MICEMCRATNNELVFLADNNVQLYKDIWFNNPVPSGVQLHTVEVPLHSKEISLITVKDQLL